MHEKWDSYGRQDHLLRQDKVNMESYTKPRGSKSPEAGLTLTDKDGEGKFCSVCVSVCLFEREKSRAREQIKVKESRVEIILFYNKSGEHSCWLTLKPAQTQV